MKAACIVVGFNHWYAESKFDKEFTKHFVIALRERNPNLTILLIDNASERPYPTNLDGIETIRLPRRCGYAVALNAGIKHLEARGFDWYLCFNNDCWIDPNEQAPVNHGRIEDTIQRLDPGFLYGSGWNEDKNTGTRFQWSAWLCISKEALVRVGMFDEALHAAFEDFDYEGRAKLAGFGLDTAPFQIVHLDEHTRLEDKNYPMEWEKARRYYEMKHGIGATESWFKV